MACANLLLQLAHRVRDPQLVRLQLCPLGWDGRHEWRLGSARVERVPIEALEEVVVLQLRDPLAEQGVVAEAEVRLLVEQAALLPRVPLRAPFRAHDAPRVGIRTR